MMWKNLSTLSMVGLLLGACATAHDAPAPEESTALRTKHQELLGLGCSRDDQCTGGLVCQLGDCVLGTCLYLPILGCEPPTNPGPEPEPEPEPEPASCTIDSDCTEGVECTIARCIDGACLYNPMVDCGQEPLPEEGCGNDAQCSDGLTCTLDICLSVGNICLNVGILGCEETGSGGASSGGASSGGASSGGASSGGASSGGASSGGASSGGASSGGASSGGASSTGGTGSEGETCFSALDCQDPDPCTLDVCVEPLGLCAHVSIPLCSNTGTGGGSGVGGDSGSGGDSSGTGGDSSGSGGDSSGSGGDSSGTGGDSSGSGGDSSGTGGDSSGSGGDSSSTGGASSSTGGRPSGSGSGGRASGSGGDSDPGSNSGGRAPISSSTGGDSALGGAGSDDGEPSGGRAPRDSDDGEWMIRGGGCSIEGPVGPSTKIGWVLAALALLLFSRRRTTRAGLGGALLVTLTDFPTASAQGFSVDSNPVPVAPEDMLWTERPSIPMDHLSFFGRAMLGYADNPLVLENTATGERLPVIDSQFALYLSAGIALFERFHVAALVPLYAQSGEAVGTQTPDGVSVGNPAADVRINILDTRHPFELGLAGRLAVPVGQSSHLVADEAASGGPRVLVGKSFGAEKRSFIALNSGLNFRQQSALQNINIDNELTFGAGINWAFLGPLAATAELSGRTTLTSPFSGDETPVGLLFGLRYAEDAFSVAGGVGPGLTTGYGAPVVRALATGGARFNRKQEEAAPPPVPARSPEPPPPEPVAIDPCLESPPPSDPAACPELDADNDGIKNGNDACPTEAEDIDGFEDTDGCPESDNDRDGIPDVDDKCPMDAETINGIDDEDGCPDKIRVLDGQISTMEPIFFETGKAVILSKSEPLLIEIAQVIKSRPELGTISIEGHTDDVGSDATNLRLSQSRAESVREFLINAGVNADRIIATGYGESRPIAEGTSREARAANRRVEFRFGAPTSD